jgi:hypothetical protein
VAPSPLFSGRRGLRAQAQKACDYILERQGRGLLVATRHWVIDKRG